MCILCDGSNLSWALILSHLQVTQAFPGGQLQGNFVGGSGQMPGSLAQYGIQSLPQHYQQSSPHPGFQQQVGGLQSGYDQQASLMPQVGTSLFTIF